MTWDLFASHPRLMGKIIWDASYTLHTSLRQRHQVDASINKYIAVDNHPSAAATSESQRARVLCFVGDVLQGTCRTPLAGAGTVMLALESSVAGIRVKALETLDAALLEGGQDGAMLREAVLRRLQVGVFDGACCACMHVIVCCCGMQQSPRSVVNKWWSTIVPV